MSVSGRTRSRRLSQDSRGLYGVVGGDPPANACSAKLDKPCDCTRDGAEDGGFGGVPFRPTEGNRGVSLLVPQRGSSLCGSGGVRFHGGRFLGVRGVLGGFGGVRACSCWVVGSVHCLALVCSFHQYGGYF